MKYVMLMSRRFYKEEYDYYAREVARLNREMTKDPGNLDLRYDRDFYQDKANDMYAKWQKAPVNGEADLWRSIDRVAQLVDKMSTHKI